MRKTLYFDMDGTIADLYGQENWLNDLLAEKRGLFRNLRIMHDKAELVNALETLRNLGFNLEIITWTPKNVSQEYVEIVENEKIAWVNENLPYFEKITCLPYGTPKQKALSTRENLQILVDDNLEVVEMWNTPQRRRSIVANENLVQNLMALV